MMRRCRWGLLCAVAVGAASDPVLAERASGALVRAPAAWRTDPEQATALAQRYAASAHLGGLPVATAAEAYVAERPAAGGAGVARVALFATRATASVSDSAQAARAARAALDELRATARRAALAGGSAAEASWQERIESAPPQIVATLTWGDPASQTIATARLVIASDGARIAAVTGECLASDTADAALVTACRTALATLDPGIAPASRVAVTPIGPAAPPGPPGAADAAEAPARSGPARLDDAPRVVFPPTVIPQPAREPDRRPVLVGAGLIAIALMFWWNRRQRDRFDREDRAPRAARRPRPSRPSGDDADDLRAAAHDADEDADDLHAAARGDRPDRPDDREDDRPP